MEEAQLRDRTCARVNKKSKSMAMDSRTFLGRGRWELIRRAHGMTETISCLDWSVGYTNVYIDPNSFH